MAFKNAYKLVFLLALFFCEFVSYGQHYPDPPVITGVTVEPQPGAPGAVRISWIPSEDTSVTGYIIYREILNGTEPNVITEDLLATDFSYVDVNVDARIKSEKYKMASLPNGLPSSFHQTIFLQPIQYDSCSMTNTLIWNRYEGSNISFYNVYANNEDITIYDQETENDTVFVDSISAKQNIDYKIEAYGSSPFNADSTILSSTSNISSIYTEPIRSPDPSNFFINNITYDGSAATFTATIDNAADLSGHVLMVSSNETSNYKKVAFDSIITNSTIDISHSGVEQPLYYKIGAIDVCHDTVFSKAVKPIVLLSESDETDVTLNWNQSYIQSHYDESYNIIAQIDNGSPFELSQTNDTSAPFNFETHFTNNSSAEVFYFNIEAHNENLTSFSNTVLVTRKIKIAAPTAFTPHGDQKNDRFGPFINSSEPEKSYIKNAVVDDFKLIIYDKYGGVVYLSDYQYDKWDGAINNKPVTEGGYIYYLWFKTAQGKTYEKSGTINVVYP
jgi:gliding motility-associated-like protein